MRKVSPKKECTTIQEVLLGWGKGTTPSLAESWQVTPGTSWSKETGEMSCGVQAPRHGGGGRKRLTVIIRRGNCFRRVLPKYASSLERGKRGISLINTEGIKNPQEASIPSEDWSWTTSHIDNPKLSNQGLQVPGPADYNRLENTLFMGDLLSIPQWECHEKALVLRARLEM